MSSLKVVALVSAVVACVARPLSPLKPLTLIEAMNLAEGNVALRSHKRSLATAGGACSACLGVARTVCVALHAFGSL